MRRLVISVLVLSAALLLQPIYGGVGGLGEAMANPSIYVDFDNNTTKGTTIPSGKTDVYPTCGGQTSPQYEFATGNPLIFHCTSPVSNVTCDRNANNDSHCVCHNGNKKSHTVNVHLTGNCK